MNEVLAKLAGDDLRSDGNANEVADEVIRNPKLLGGLVQGLDEPDDVVRARTAHAIERISRANQETLLELMTRFIGLATKDKVPMVRWHLAMIFGNMALLKEAADLATSALMSLLDDESVFVRSWAIVSITLIGRRDKSKRLKIVDRIKTLQHSNSIAIRTKARKAMDILQDEDIPIPLGWSKLKES
jgi:HEAT repeat protein